ncbi:DUF3043 domain-containing protein [Diaminobutyricimonas sp. LJ205]|uniref:DUF3043 domain-containing protein n=1 Tax=Diaminobutyricimonas sp. LJ205 TaxID=2683590 RepID=UPI001E4158AC|nr:DUF3043 domain-containing protein [Diaminobutyricimonas sp. LJ205]
MSDNTPAPDSEAEPTDGAVGKGQPTPSRKEREAANKRPLVPGDRKVANKEARAKMAEAREKARIGIANGEERYLPERDKGPQKRYVRDYVDARTSIGEFMIPVMFLVIIITFVPDPSTQVIAMLTLWLFFGLAVIDSVILGFLVRKKLRVKFGEDRVERGVRWYAAMRSLQLRVMRLPKPQVKRGHFPK